MIWIRGRGEMGGTEERREGSNAATAGQHRIAHG